MTLFGQNVLYQDGNGQINARTPLTFLVVKNLLHLGIHLWVKGRRELDWMLDDYAERYGPKSIAVSLTVVPTMNDFGLAYNF